MYTQEMVEQDKKFAAQLRSGPVNPVFKKAFLPDFRLVDSLETVGMSPQNLGRFELYMKRLAMVGANPIENRMRAETGRRLMETVQPKPVVRRVHDLGVVHRRFLVVR